VLHADDGEEDETIKINIEEIVEGARTQGIEVACTGGEEQKKRAHAVKKEGGGAKVKGWETDQSGLCEKVKDLRRSQAWSDNPRVITSLSVQRRGSVTRMGYSGGQGVGARTSAGTRGEERQRKYKHFTSGGCCIASGLTGVTQRVKGGGPSV